VVKTHHTDAFGIKTLK